MAARGKPFEPGNTLSRGRPRGSRNKTTKARELLDNYAEPLVRKLLTSALHGDMKALQLCIERVIPVCRELPVNLGSLPVGTLAEANRSYEKVVKMVATGKLTPTQGQARLDLIERRRHFIETEELEKGMSVLESKS